MSLEKKAVMKVFLTSQFGYYPLAFMFQSRGLDNQINHLHKSELRAT